MSKGLVYWYLTKKSIPSAISNSRDASASKKDIEVTIRAAKVTSAFQVW